MREITDKEIKEAGDKCLKQFISHPPNRSDYVGGFVVGAYWMRGELEGELGAAQEREKRLAGSLTEASNMVRSYDPRTMSRASLLMIANMIDDTARILASPDTLSALATPAADAEGGVTP